MTYKWNKIGSGVSKHINGIFAKSIPLDHRFWGEEVDPWIAEGNDIEPYKTDDELISEEIASWEAERDDLERSAILLYDGNLFYMTPRARQNMDASRGSLERGKELNWPCYDPNTGEKKRVKISKVEFDKFGDALFDAIDLLHTQADTQMPDNPWPLEVL